MSLRAHPSKSGSDRRLIRLEPVLAQEPLEIPHGPGVGRKRGEDVIQTPGLRAHSSCGLAGQRLFAAKARPCSAGVDLPAKRARSRTAQALRRSGRLDPDIPELKSIAPEELTGDPEGAPKGNVRTFKVDVNLGKLTEAGIIRSGRKWPKGYPPDKVDLWVAVFVQEDPEDSKSCLAEVRSYVFGSDLGPRDLGVELDATKAVYEDDRIPWVRTWYEGPEQSRLRDSAPAE